MGRKTQWKIEEERRIAEAEEEKRLLRADQQRRSAVASGAGFYWANLTDPLVPPFDCPTCGAAVTLSGVERHIEWHVSSPDGR